MATSGHLAIGLMAPTATIGYQAYGYGHHGQAFYGRPPIGVLKEAYMASMPVIGARTSGSTEASTTAMAIAAPGM